MIGKIYFKFFYLIGKFIKYSKNVPVVGLSDCLYLLESVLRVPSNFI